MTYLFIRHKVKNYGSWKSAFDRFIETRRSGGEKSYQIFHPSDDINNLYLIFEWNNLENAKKFIESPQLKEAMQKAGVIEAPEIHFLEEVAHGTTTLAYASA